MKRLALICLLVIALAWVPIGFGSVDYANSPFLDSEDLIGSGDSHHGEQALIYGQLVSVDPTFIRVDFDEAHYRFRVTDVGRDLELGQYLEVYGEVESENTVAANGVVVRGETEHWYTYGISLLAGLIVFGRIVRDCHIDLDAFGLVPKEDR